MQDFDKELKLLRKIADYVEMLIESSQEDENSTTEPKEIYLSQEVLEMLWQANKDYQIFQQKNKPEFFN